MLGPVIEELAKEYDGKAKICKLNTDDAAEVSAQYRIESIPTIMIFKDGAPKAQLVGLQSKEELKKQLDANL
jgi:thioredoxin 1